MFRIRRVYDDLSPGNKSALQQVRDIFISQFPDAGTEKFDHLSDQFLNPLKYLYRSVLFVAEDEKHRVKGFAIFLHFSDRNFCYLDFVAADKLFTSRGIGGALYERIREEAYSLKTKGLFFECLPDDPALCNDPVILKQNKARLRFYEKYGARPVINTRYETPVKPGDDNPPYLVMDDLGKGVRITGKDLREIMRAIMERKYGDYCPEEYNRLVVDSVSDNPVELRNFRYVRSIKESVIPVIANKIYLLINDRHDIHYVRERGYVESPVRIASILKELDKTGLFEKAKPLEFPEDHIKKVHNPLLFNYIKQVCMKLDEKKSVHPYVFPIRNNTRPPKDMEVRAGYYCIDTFTPLHKNVFPAAKRAVDCALTGAEMLVAGKDIVYALIRPPGHHAERNVFGGFCYFNSNAVAADYLSKYGKVAILDIDFHHGNGQQEIFYGRKDVLTISIHGHPSFAYPYFSGFREERGEGEGLGLNRNFPLPEEVTGERYREVLNSSLKLIREFRPAFLVVALGLDTAKGDPTGTWLLSAEDFRINGSMIGKLGIPTLVVQEGGYRNRSIGINARNFFNGLHTGYYKTGSDAVL
ncbi:MAG: histone deacetylase family protein [Bacteroidetes bacterium]|nr:histone deacetylase family protein [Bacteroidota bacterium]